MESVSNGTREDSWRLCPFKGGTELTSRNSPLRLAGERKWLLHGAAAQLDAVAAALPGMHQRLDIRLLLLSFGNAVGSFHLPVLGNVDVVSGKWSQAHYDDMLSDLTRIASNLPFSVGDTAALPYDRSVATREDLLYHAFIYLRHVLSDIPSHEQRLLTAFRLVLGDPHNRWERVNRIVPLDQVGRVGPDTLHALATGGGGASDLTVATAISSPVLHRLGGHAPYQVPEQRVERSVDTPENRFCKALLDQCRGVLLRIKQEGAGQGDAFGLRIGNEARRLDLKLASVRNHGLWRSVGRMTHLPTGSTVLQQRRGYAQILEHFSRLRLAAKVPLDKAQVQGLLEGKDIALLYEIWAFFTVAEALEGILGKATATERVRTTPFEARVPWDFRVSWGNSVHLIYNPRFSRSRPMSRRSYSVPLRPDIGLEVRRGDSFALHLLDAKFKVEKLDSTAENEDEEMDKVEAAERLGDYKRADLYKMHTYRDAIPRAETAWILYPGTEFRFFDEKKGRVEDPGKVGPGARGVGGIPLLPGGGHDRLCELMETLVG